MASPTLGGTPLAVPPSTQPPAAAPSSQSTARAVLPITLSSPPAGAPPQASPAPPSFTFPLSHSYRPMYTLQPNLVTREAQFKKWSRIILSYCAHHNLFVLSFPDLLDSPLFRNRTIQRALGESEVRAVVTWMASDAGGRRAEWKTTSGTGASSLWGPVLPAASKPGQERAFWVYWRRVDEWADTIYAWVEGTGQKGSVLTLWEILEGEGTAGEKFHGMDGELFERALKMLVKRGKAQMFGEEDSRGIKFF